MCNKTFREEKSGIKLVAVYFNTKAMPSKWGGDETDYCRFCQDGEETETAKHLLYDSPRLDT